MITRQRMDRSTALRKRDTSHYMKRGSTPILETLFGPTDYLRKTVQRVSRCFNATNLVHHLRSLRRDLRNGGFRLLHLLFEDFLQLRHLLLFGVLLGLYF